jgi:hypothetical protein
MAFTEILLHVSSVECPHKHGDKWEAGCCRNTSFRLKLSQFLPPLSLLCLLVLSKMTSQVSHP